MEKEEYFEPVDNEGWSDEEEVVDPNLLQAGNDTDMGKKPSAQINTYSVYEVYPKVIALAKSVQETLNLSLDDAITILRYYKWNKYKMEEKWFDDMDQLSIQIGLKFNTDILKTHP